MSIPHRVIRSTWRWSPVFVLALLVWQLKTAGLDPALAERDRLAAARVQVEQSHAESGAQLERLQVEYEAWQDPTYRERRRRALKASRAELSSEK